MTLLGNRIKKNVIPRNPRRGRLKGRTAPIQAEPGDLAITPTNCHQLG
jgi:hypothetical protein